MKIASLIKDSKIRQKAIQSQRYRIILTATASLALNLLYALYNGILGIFTHSFWFVTMCSYYIILSAMRFSAVTFERKRQSKSTDITEAFIMKICGIMLIFLMCIVSTSVYLSFRFDVAVKYHEIVMITIATYTFTKTTLAIIKVVKIEKKRSMLLTTIRNISFADAGISLLSMQRSMLASFGDINDKSSLILNAFLGAIVCLYILLLGVRMINIARRKERKMENVN